jgi:membrane-bound lytic murein transglycosylase A
LKKLIPFILFVLCLSCNPKSLNQGCECDIKETKEKSEECNLIDKKSEKKESVLPYSQLIKTDWYEVDFILSKDNLADAWPAWINSCSVLIKQKNKNINKWKKVCDEAFKMENPSNSAIYKYLKNNFNLFKSWNDQGSDKGLITGYYQPILKGSRLPSKKYSTPIYQTPKDLITVDLSDIYPEMKYKRLRGKIEGNKLKPYFSREQISSKDNLLRGSELFWVDDPVEAFFLEIQGSGIIELEDGIQIPIGYADQNGHPYRSMGRALIQAGELSKHKVTMQSIKAWGKKNKKKLKNFLNKNPSYVFFRELEKGLAGPIGAQGIPILAQRSIAIDRRYIPMGAPTIIATTYPNSNESMNRLVIAQDTGGAIKGEVRVDYFWGSGPEAGRSAGAMKQEGNVWVVLPKGFKFNKKKEQ